MIGIERYGPLMAKKRKSARRDDNRVGKVCIGVIIIIFVAVMSAQISKVYQKDQEKIAQEQELREQLQYELDRQEELKEYQEYINSKEYVEEQAQSKLSLLYENQIIFREKKD